MSDKHLSTQFDTELNAVSSRVMELGGMVESQIQQAVYALQEFDAEAAERVSETEHRVNAMEIEIDRELSSIIARRQPTARDLRLLIAISKTTANLERVGDEANKIARMVKSIIESGAARALPSSDLRIAADMASGLLRKLITYMMEDPRMISSSIDLIFVAKAIERVGDHAKNLAEAIIYVVKGTDVRHTSVEAVENVVR